MRRLWLRSTVLALDVPGFKCKLTEHQWIEGKYVIESHSTENAVTDIEAAGFDGRKGLQSFVIWKSSTQHKLKLLKIQSYNRKLLLVQSRKWAQDAVFDRDGSWLLSINSMAGNKGIEMLRSKKQVAFVELSASSTSNWSYITLRFDCSGT